MVIQILNKIFSVKNEYTDFYKRKIITILGLKLKFKNTKFELKCIQKKLHNIQDELHNIQDELHNTQDELHNTQNELHNTQNELHNTQDKLHNTQDELKSNQREIEGLHRLLNMSIDITKVPPATGLLRKNQLLQLTFLEIIDIILKKHNINYWLDYGTLLGAVRHKGFVPWDDDIDIGLVRSDYNKIPEIIELELSKYGIYYNFRKVYWNLLNNKIVYLCDFFPYDKFYKKNIQDSEIKILKNKIINCYNEFFGKYHWNVLNSGEVQVSTEEIDGLTQKKIMENKSSLFDADLFTGYDSLPWGYAQVYRNQVIFPLNKTLSFEGHEFPVPNDYKKYLSIIYGNYMSFPKNTERMHVCGHFDNESLKNVDFDKLINKLKQIKDEISEGLEQ